MKEGIWVWPSNQKEQYRVMKRVAKDPRLFTALKSIARSKDGMSNPEVDEGLGNNSDWVTIWTVRQLLALGFIDYKVDLFGGPSRYFITELGKQVLAKLSGQPPQPIQPASQHQRAA